MKVVVASAVGFSASDEAMSIIVTGKGTLAPVSAGQANNILCNNE
ncbi:MAG: hypothetical protein ACNYNY_00710 [Candidatus Oxydemutatoraceae bacterium WSBS_2016_MAG_OTU14]